MRLQQQSRRVRFPAPPEVLLSRKLAVSLMARVAERLGVSPVSPRGGVAFFATLLLALHAGASGTVARLSAPEVPLPDQTAMIAVPIIFTAPASQRVVAAQFDVEYDGDALAIPATDGIVESTAVKTAGKQLRYTALSKGRARILLIGFNQECLPAGELITVHFAVTPQRMNAHETISITHACLSDFSGMSIPVETKAGRINYAAAGNAATLDPSSAPWAIAPVLATAMAGAGILVRHLRRKRRREERNRR